MGTGLGILARRVVGRIWEREVWIPSSVDGYRQPAMFHPGKPGSPVLIHLHSWDRGYDNTSTHRQTRAFARTNGWTFISPDFRGPASSPAHLALHAGSEAAINDVLDARQYALANSGSDPARVYLFGSSGGDFMGKLVAARHPHLFKAVAGNAGIMDLAAWWASCVNGGTERLHRYARSIEAIFGGTPDQRPAEYAARSPLGYLDGLQGLPVHFQHGIADHVVPLEHSLMGFNAVVRAKGRHGDVIGEYAYADLIEKSRKASGDLTNDVLHRRRSGDVQIIVEQAKHAGDLRHAFDFLLAVEAGTLKSDRALAEA